MGNEIFSPSMIGNIELKNRVIKSGCFEGMSQNGEVTDKLIEHHSRIAAGGAAMTTVAYCSVSYDGRAFENELWIREAILHQLEQLVQAVHQKKALASIQLGHCGYFASRKVIQSRPIGASAKFNLFRLSYCREMTEQDIEEKINDFVKSASISKMAGFDAIEIHAGHGYLLSQFLSPWTNLRKDKYGGTLENRMRFPAMVIRHIRKELGQEFPIIVKMNYEDGMKEGLNITEAVEIAKMFEKEGASAIIPSAGFTSKTPFYMLRGNLPVNEMVKNQKNLISKLGLALFGHLLVKKYRFTRLFQIEEAKKIQRAVNIPVIYLGGILCKEDIVKALNYGFEFVQIGRALIHDPDMVTKMEKEIVPEKLCDHCNRCVAAMDAGNVYCVSQEKGYL